MIRNREMKRYILWLLLPALLFSAAGFFLSAMAGVLVSACSICLFSASMLFTRWRYAQIQRLSDYLGRINNGEYILDVRDNAEGELSILKNEIYKVTVTLKRQNEALQRDKAALQRALSDISHQIKTPLTSLSVMTDLLADAGLPDEKRIEFTDSMHAQFERLQWLVSSLLKLSRLDAKSVDFQCETVAAKELLQRVLDPLLIPAEIKGQTIDAVDNGIMLCCDVNWTVEALVNILKNCVEHTPQNGRILIVCTENPMFIQLRITDSGPGIDKADLPHIWERFYRGKNAPGDSVGIGLAMAAAIVQEQGGSIEAQSTRSGSVFTIRFPR